MDEKNYIVINNEKISLSNNQLKKLGLFEKIEPINSRTPFKRAENGKHYFHINIDGNVAEIFEDNDNTDIKLFKAANYFSNAKFANQVSWHQNLYRRLLKFAYDNDYYLSTSDEDTQAKYWYICWNGREFIADFTFRFNRLSGFEVYFKSKEYAEEAIEKVIKPFMTEHPVFKWNF